MSAASETHESNWKKSFTGPRALILWPAFIILIIAALIFIIAARSDTQFAQPFMASSAIAAVLAAAVLVSALIVWPLLHWLFWEHWRGTLLALGCLALLVVLAYTAEDWRGKDAWENYKREWQVKGEKFDLASFVPPPVPDDQNFAMTPIVASSYNWIVDETGHELHPHKTNVVNRLSMRIYRNDNSTTPTNGDWANATLTDLQVWQAYYRAPVRTNWQVPIATNEFPIAPNPQSPAKDVLLALSRYDSDIEELRRASELPYSRFPLEYDKDEPAQIWLPHLGALAQCGRTLQLRAIAETQLNQTEKAAADVKLMFRLAAASQNEPFLISHLVRIRIVNDALQPIYEALGAHKWSDAQLTEVDSELAKLDFLADYQRSMRSEAAYSAKMVDYVQRTHKISSYLDTFNVGSPPAKKMMDAICFVAPGGWYHENQLRFSRFYLEQCLPLADTRLREVSPKTVDRLEANFRASLAHASPYNELERIFLLPMGQLFDKHYVVVEKFAYGQESLDLARVAIALDRYRLAHNQYPESLDVLSPQFMAKVPHDIIDGGPLKYRRTNDNFTLYSIGWNETDDGGTYGSLDSDTGDWVWQYPTG